MVRKPGGVTELCLMVLVQAHGGMIELGLIVIAGVIELDLEVLWREGYGE